MQDDLNRIINTKCGLTEPLQMCFREKLSEKLGPDSNV